MMDSSLSADDRFFDAGYDIADIIYHIIHYYPLYFPSFASKMTEGSKT